MEQLQQFTADQRKALADLLKPTGDIRQQANTRYTDQYDALEASSIEKIARKKKLYEVAVKVKKAQDQIKQWEQTIKATGLHLNSDGSFEFDWGSDPLKDEIKGYIEKEIGTRSDIEKRLASALLKIWTVPTLNEAAKVVESLLA